MSGFVQLEYFGRMFRVLSSKNQSGDPNSISAREALLVSVGGRVGGGTVTATYPRDVVVTFDFAGHCEDLAD